MFGVRSFLAAAVVAAFSFPASAQHSHRHHGHSHGAHDHDHQVHPPRAKRQAARKAPPRAQRPPAHRQHAAHQHANPAHGHAHHELGGHDHGVETENLFGFVLGSDVEPRGTRSVAVEAIGRFGKRMGTYNAVGGKAEFAYGVSDSLSVAGAVLGAFYNVNGVPGFADVTRVRLNGLGGEVRWRVFNREKDGFGLTFHIEPVWATSDELTGIAARKFGAENKIILDAALVPEKLFAAFNVIHEMEVVKEKGSPFTERAAKIGAGVALAAAVTRNVYVGAEARMLYAYDGLGFGTYAGRAAYMGPTIHAKFDNGMWASLAWSVQVSGSEKGVAGRYDLTNFERHMVRLKAGYDF